MKVPLVIAAVLAAGCVVVGVGCLLGMAGLAFAALMDKLLGRADRDELDAVFSAEERAELTARFKAIADLSEPTREGP